MYKKLFLVCLLYFGCSYVQAQTTKPAVLVVGNGSAAAGAAIQSARSGVKTILLLQAGGFDIHNAMDDFSSGIQVELLTEIKKQSGINDSLNLATIDKHLANKVLSQLTDTIKNLAIIRDLNWVRAARSGKNWNFRLSNRQTIRPKVLVLAGDARLKESLMLKEVSPAQASPLDYSQTLYRTSIASGTFLNKTTSTIVSLYSFLTPSQENLILLRENESMLIGQAAGAIAAYAGFFGANTSSANLKIIQGELINYKLAVMPFVDIRSDDPNWKAIQMLGLSGVIKAENIEHSTHFSALNPVSTEEIKQPLKDFFYKAQIWFDDYKAETMTVESTISLICYVGNKSAESTLKEIEKKWKSSYKFTRNFDLKSTINRREFAVLLQDYMPPFNVNVDKDGKVIR